MTRLITLAVLGLLLAACDSAASEEYLGSYRSAALSVDADGSRVDLLAAGGVLTLSFTSQDPAEVYGQLNVPASLTGHEDADADVFYAILYFGSFERTGDRVTFDVEAVDVSAYSSTDGLPDESAPPLSEFEANGLVSAFVADPVWTIGVEKLESGSGTVEARLEKEVLLD